MTLDIITINNEKQFDALQIGQKVRIHRSKRVEHYAGKELTRTGSCCTTSPWMCPVTVYEEDGFIVKKTIIDRLNFPKISTITPKNGAYSKYKNIIKGEQK